MFSSRMNILVSKCRRSYLKLLLMRWLRSNDVARQYIQAGDQRASFGLIETIHMFSRLAGSFAVSLVQFFQDQEVKRLSMLSVGDGCLEKSSTS
jgi:hypothetical protein